MKMVLGIAACVAAMLLAVPTTASAATIQAHDTAISVADNAPEGNYADDFVVTQVDAWQVTITNNGGDAGEPLLLVDEQGTNLDCMQADPRTVHCFRFTGGPPISIDVYGNFGNDRFTVGPHHSSVSVRVRGHFGDDFIVTDNGSVDQVSCGGDTDVWTRDGLDTLMTHPSGATIANDCETIFGGSGGGGGGDTGGGGTGGGSTGTPTTPTSPVIVPATLLPNTLTVEGRRRKFRSKLSNALKNGVKVGVKTSASAKVKATLALKAGDAKKLKLGKKAVVVAHGSKTVTPAGATIKVSFTQKAKQRLAKLPSKALPLKLVVTVAGQTAATENVLIVNDRRTGFGGG
jgi:hypothetical protein